MMGPFEAVGSVFSRFAQFSGRASRAEFWWFATFNVIARITCLAIDFWFLLSVGDFQTNLMNFDPWNSFFVFYTLLAFIPTLAVSARRLHDGGFSGFWMCLYIIIVPAFLISAVLSSIEVFAMRFGLPETDMIMQTLAILQLAASSVYMLLSLLLFVFYVWPSDPDDNIHGAPWRPFDTKPRVLKDGTVKRNPLQGYAILMEMEREIPDDVKAAREEARKDEVRRLYQERVLGQRPSEA